MCCDFIDVVTGIANVVVAVGVWYARDQLKSTREIAQLQFEDSLGREYRELANRLSPHALLGHDLDELKYEEAFDELFHYVDLSNEQIRLRQCGRVSKEVWDAWADGIRTNMELPAFARAWEEIKAKSSSFQELRRFLSDSSLDDPRHWC